MSPMMQKVTPQPRRKPKANRGAIKALCLIGVLMLFIAAAQAIVNRPWICQ